MLRIFFRFLNVKPPLKLPSLCEKYRSDTKPIAKYFDDNLICVYNSITEAQEKTNLEVTEIWESLDRNKIINGFMFKRI